MRDARPPRALPVRAKLALYGNFAALFGLSFLVGGAIFLTVAYHLTDFSSFIYFRDNDPVTTGVLIEKSQSSATVTSRRGGGYYLYQYRYTYQVGTASYHGTSYAKENDWKSGAPLTVAYVPNKPELSRIKGMTSAPIVVAGLGLGIAAGAMAMIGFVSACFGVFWARKYIRLVRNGLLATGVVTGKIATNTTTNGKRDYKIHFQFTHQDGRTCTATVTTNEIEQLEEGRDEKVLYLPSKPSNAVLVDTLPLKVRTLVPD
ncbi:MAG: DUF3592 domain-containing protein [Telluria sp.]